MHILTNAVKLKNKSLGQYLELLLEKYMDERQRQEIDTAIAEFIKSTKLVESESSESQEEDKSGTTSIEPSSDDDKENKWKDLWEKVKERVEDDKKKNPWPYSEYEFPHKHYFLKHDQLGDIKVIC